MTQFMAPPYGVVVIGRNEGERLSRCLQSLAGNLIVYVDSGSTDASIEQSRQQGALVVELSMKTPFTAARARNAGVAKLLSEYPDIEFVQFVDGDCELNSSWTNAALKELKNDQTLAAVSGLRQEINRSGSIYNLLCDIEWHSPVGTAEACGGDAMYRIAAFRAVGQFDESFIAGEEPELCYRLRHAGWTIKRIGEPMTEHDAAMFRFKQWWKRCQRSGYAYALGAWKHGAGPHRYNVKQCLSILFWAAGVPAAVLSAIFFNLVIAVMIWLGSYGYLGLKVYRQTRQQRPGFARRQIALYSTFVVLQKFPELIGVLRCSWQHFLGRRMSIIEYK